MDKPNPPLRVTPAASLEERDALTAELEQYQSTLIEMTDVCIQLRAERNQIASERDALAFQNQNREGLVARAIEKEEQYDALEAHVERLREAFKKDYGTLNWTWVKDVLDDAPATSLARRDSRVAAKTMREIAEWMDPDSEKFSGPTCHEAEMIGMEISGPTFCSDARRCIKAGNRAFLEAARIWEYKSQRAEGES